MIQALRNKFRKLNLSFENKSLKISLEDTKVIVSGGSTIDSLSKSNVSYVWCVA